MLNENTMMIDMMNLFIKYCNKQPKIEKLYYKKPIKNADFMFNRIVIVSNDLVYKIHPVEYTEKQKELIKNLKVFFENYSQTLDITEHYKEDLCWTAWTKIQGELLGKGHLENYVWEEYLDLVVRTWKEHYKRSQELNVPKGQMWWHYDVTPWNVIVQPDGTSFLIDWDDFHLMNIEEIKPWTINQNIEYAEINNQNQELIHSKFENLYDC